MTRHLFADDPERADFVDPSRTRDLPLFTKPGASIEAGMSALRDTASKHEAEIIALVPLARELAGKAPRGITVSDLRLYAVQRGLLSGDERGRALSYLGTVLSAAGLEPTGEWRRSSILKSHGNPHRVFRLPDSEPDRGDAA